ncbi:hypothetical protein [Streptomyces sp. NPDC058548]|uniref:hypothetical protein n=1 Tax=Streptomyces sp. NPDC058548 TaxID=3346545 RepID=UPI0036560FE3
MTKREAAVMMALALAANYFPGTEENGRPTASFRHAAFLLSGHYDIWCAWHTLQHVDKQRIGAVLREAPKDLANEKVFTKAARGILGAPQDAQPMPFVLSGDESARAEAATPRVGGDLLSYVDRTLSRTRKGNARRKPSPPAGPGVWLTRSFYTPGSGLSRGKATIPDFDTESSAITDLPEIRTAPYLPDVGIDSSELLDIAVQVDQRLRPSERHLHQVLKNLFDQLNTTDTVAPSKLIRLVAGQTEVCNAPTGTGKSVFVRVVASWCAINGMAVTLVMPTVEATLVLADSISLDLQHLGRQETCTPLMSPYGLHDRATKLVSRIEGPFGELSAKTLRKMDHLSYGCALKHYTEISNPYPPGRESCTTLIPLPPASGNRRCPFTGTCGKFEQHRNACTASVIVTNHHNFMLGKFPIGVVLDDKPVADLTVAEFAFRRGPVIIDEIDQFQSTAVGMCSSELVLASRRLPSTPLRDLDADQRNMSPDVATELCDPISHTRRLAEFLLNSICDSQLHLRTYEGNRPATGQYGTNSTGWHLSGSRDRRLIALLFPDAGITDDREVPAELFDRLNALRPARPNPVTAALSADEDTADLEPYLQDVRNLLGSLLATRGENILSATRHALDDVLQDVVEDPHDRAEAIELIIVRTWLSELDDALGFLTTKTSQLRAEGLPSAHKLAQRLETGVASNVLPHGMLGRAIFGYRVTGLDDPGKSAELTSQSISGDPHTYTAQLGSIVSLTLAGVERPVMGLSATAYFPQAVREHIHAPVKWWMTDATPDSIRARRNPLTNALGQEIQISGLPQSMKRQALITLGERLYEEQIRGELERIRRKDKDRAHAAVVVNSYEHCRYLALGIASHPLYEGGLCVAVPSDKQRRDGLPALPSGVIELTPDEFESFPERGNILIVPMARIARGLNIVIGTKSAITPVYLCTRPLALLTDPPEMYASVNAAGLNSLPKTPTDDPIAALSTARAEAWGRLGKIIRSSPGFVGLDKELQAEIVAGMIIDMIQLAGRARRGGTDMTLHLVDYAFHADAWQADLGKIIRKMHKDWPDDVRQRMNAIYREALAAFLAYAGIDPADH